MRVEASRELAAPREDVWGFLAEPYHLPDWWPGISGVQPDRRGLAADARWTVTTAPYGTLLRRPQSTQTLVVLRVERPRLVAWRFTADRLDVEVRLEALDPERTLATVAIEGPYRLEILTGPRRTVPRTALNRLHALCQTAARL